MRSRWPRSASTRNPAGGGAPPPHDREPGQLSRHEDHDGSHTWPPPPLPAVSQNRRSPKNRYSSAPEPRTVRNCATPVTQSVRWDTKSCSTCGSTAATPSFSATSWIRPIRSRTAAPTTARPKLSGRPIRWVMSIRLAKSRVRPERRRKWTRTKPRMAPRIPTLMRLSRAAMVPRLPTSVPASGLRRQLPLLRRARLH